MKLQIGRMLPTQKLNIYEIEITAYEGDGNLFYILYKIGTKET